MREEFRHLGFFSWGNSLIFLTKFLLCGGYETTLVDSFLPELVTYTVPLLKDLLKSSVISLQRAKFSSGQRGSIMCD